MYIREAKVNFSTHFMMALMLNGHFHTLALLAHLCEWKLQFNVSAKRYRHIFTLCEDMLTFFLKLQPNKPSVSRWFPVEH